MKYPATTIRAFHASPELTGHRYFYVFIPPEENPISFQSSKKKPESLFQAVNAQKNDSGFARIGQRIIR